MSARYAVYFSPKRHSPWWEFGAHWLGRNEYDHSALPQPQLEDIPPAELARITAEPRRYGFHATLKPPFRLAATHDETGLLARLRKLASTLEPVVLSPLRVATLGNFVALIPDTNHAGLQALASACVLELDDFRAALRATDLARRGNLNLDAREAELLALYGYPYVMDRFRFHLTLTGPMESSAAPRISHALAESVSQLNRGPALSLDHLCLFVERTPGAAFQRIADVALSA